jgi:hypothetical protein
VAADLGQPVHLAIRPDGRDAGLMAAFSQAFAVSQTPHTNLAGAWPANLSMDPFLFNFSRFAPGAPLCVAALDSTASLPFLRLGLEQRHYFGAPSRMIEAIFRDQPVAMTRLRDKMTTLERHARAVATETPMEITRLDPMFFWTRPGGG